MSGLFVIGLLATTAFSRPPHAQPGRPAARSAHATRAHAERAHVEASLGRLVRQGIYAAVALDAGIGAFSAAQEVAAAAQRGLGGSELLASASGLGLDLGVLGIVAFSYSVDKRAASSPKKPPASASAQPLAEQLTATGELQLTINMPEPFLKEEGKPVLRERELPVHLLQEQAKQTLVLAVGSPSAVQDVVLSAVVESRESPGLFAKSDVLLVPLVFEREEGSALDAVAPPEPKKGFGKSRFKPVPQTYVATPRPDERASWSRALDAEVAAARVQGARAVPPFDPLDRGLLFVLGPGQKVLQRRLGLPAWSSFVEEIKRERAQADVGSSEVAATPQ